MAVTTLFLKCHLCGDPMGSFQIDDTISIVSAEQVFQFLAKNRIWMLCDICSKNGENNK